MNIRNFVLLLVTLFSIDALADDEDTIVYGAAANKEGKQNVFIVEQPKNAPNPLGDPIPTPDGPVEIFGDVYNKNANQINSNNFNSSRQQNLGDDFQNTLLEANDRVYDIQSYPKADFKVMGNPANPQTIYSPNVND